MPAKRIKGPTRKGGVKPPTSEYLDGLREYQLMRTHQAKNSRTTNINPWSKAKDSKAT